MTREGLNSNISLILSAFTALCALMLLIENEFFAALWLIITAYILYRINTVLYSLIFLFISIVLMAWLSVMLRLKYVLSLIDFVYATIYEDQKSFKAT